MSGMILHLSKKQQFYLNKIKIIHVYLMWFNRSYIH